MGIKKITQMSNLNAKKVNFIASLLNEMYTDPQFSFLVFKLCYVSRYLQNTYQQILDTGNLRNDIPLEIRSFPRYNISTLIFSRQADYKKKMEIVTDKYFFVKSAVSLFGNDILIS